MSGPRHFGIPIPFGVRCPAPLKSARRESQERGSPLPSLLALLRWIARVYMMLTLGTAVAAGALAFVAMILIPCVALGAGLNLLIFGWHS